jgi:hypothetical protein
VTAGFLIVNWPLLINDVANVCARTGKRLRCILKENVTGCGDFTDHSHCILHFLLSYIITVYLVIR